MDLFTEWPRCARCDMPVEEFLSKSGVSSTGLGFVKLIARCHGDEEVVMIPDTIWDTYDPSSVKLTEAFAQMK